MNVNVSVLLENFNEKSSSQTVNTDLVIVNALIYVINSYFLKMAPSFVLTMRCRNANACNFYNALLEQLLLMNPTLLQLVVLNKNLTQKVPGDRSFNLILVDSYLSFSDIDVIYFTQEYDVNEYYFIHLQAPDEILLMEMEKIFNYCWRNFLINCNVQIQNAKGEILVYTYYPFTSEFCHKVVPKLIDQFNGKSFTNVELFPKKLRNFYGCPLNVALWDVPPFIYMKTYKNGTKRLTRGFEAILLREVASKLNFTIVILEPPNNEQRGKIIGKKLTGALGMLQSRQADLTLGSFRYVLERAIVTTSTLSYYQSAQIICISEAAYKFSSEEILLFPFQADTWLLLTFILFLGFAVTVTINNFYKRNLSVIPGNEVEYSCQNYLLMFIGLSSVTLPESNNARFFCIVWMFFTLIIRSIYMSLLFHLIRAHISSRLPKTFDDLIAGKYTAVLNRATLESLKDVELMRLLKTKILNTTIETSAFELIDNMSQKNLIAVGPIDFLLHFSRVNKKAGAFKLLPDNVVNYQLTIYLTKHSFLIDQLNDELMWLRVMGFIHAWKNTEQDMNYFNSDHLFKDQIFGWKELNMLFICTLYGLLLAFIVFLIELLSKRVKILRRIFMKFQNFI